MSSDLAIAQQAIEQLQDGDAHGALARLRRLALSPPDAGGAGDAALADRLAGLDAACNAAGSPEALRTVLQRFEAAFPDWDEPSYRLAVQYSALGDIEAAEHAYGSCVEKNPTRPEVLLALGKLLLARWTVEPAAKLLKLCCALAPTQDDAWNTLGKCLMMQGNATLANGAFAKAQRLAPQNVEYALNRAEAALAGGRAEEELNRLEQASEAEPGNAAYLVARGELLARLGQRDIAIDLLEAAAALAPEDRLANGRLAERLAHTMRVKEAEAALERALALDPDNPNLAIMLSVAILRQTRYREACALLERMIERIGEDSALLGNLSTATVALGLQEAAEAQVRRGIAATPDNPTVWRTLCNNLPYRDGVSAAELTEVARETGRLWPRDATPPHLGNRRDPNRRLRIGLLSGTLKMHPVGWLTIAGLEALDPKQFELVRLTAFAQADYISQRFIAIAPECHDTALYDDAGLARHIRSIGIDILFELGGYGDLGRMPVCAYRAAPVQVKWVGMQNQTTGIAEMDWIMADRWEIPPELEALYTERPMRMPDGYVCYSPPPDAPDVSVLPALANGYFTFGCFTNLAKVTPRVIATWSRVLQRVPGARLILKSPQFYESETRDDINAKFAAHGIDDTRLVLRGASAHRALLAEYGDIDIVLDPFPYNGGLTTCEALWMGVPTVSLAGDFFAARHSLSHLSNVGLADWVTQDIDAYVELAIARAADLPALAELRAGMRERVRRSPLCDAPRFGRNLGVVLRRAWVEWCSK